MAYHKECIIKITYNACPQSTLRSLSLSLLLGLIILIRFSYAAWSEPTVTPPDGNAAAPLTISSAAQNKTGPLSISSVTAYTAPGAYAPIYYDSNNTNYYLQPSNTSTSAVFAGNVGIGTAPMYQFDIGGGGNGDMVLCSRSACLTGYSGAYPVLKSTGTYLYLDVDGTYSGWMSNHMLTYFGTVRSTIGGFQFPDGTVQMTAAGPGANLWASNGTGIYNANSGNVGIGTTSPSEVLDVNGAIQANKHLTNLAWTIQPSAAWVTGYVKLKTPIVYNEGNGFSIKIFGYRYGLGGKPIEIRCGGYAYSASGFISSGCYTVGTNDPVGIGVDTDNTIMITIGSAANGNQWYWDHFTAQYSGDVVHRSSGFTWSFVQGANPTTINTNNAYIDDANGTLTLDSSSSPIVDIRASNGGPWALRFYRTDLGGGPQLFADSASSLYLSGSFRTTGNMTAANYYSSLANPYLNFSSYFVAPGGAYFNSGTVYAEAPIQARGGVHNDNAGYLTISGGTSGYTYFSGNVGIGTTFPGYALDVAGVSCLGNRALCTGDGNEIWTQNTTNGLAILYVNYRGYADSFSQPRNLWIGNGEGGNIMYVDGATNRVGIGTTSPNYKLTVSGNIGISGNIGGNYALAPNYAGWGSSGTGDGGAAVYNDNGSYKSLMIVGNNSAGGSRQVAVWDYLTINGGETITGGLNMGNTAIANLANPVNAQDAATKAYVDASSGGGCFNTYCNGNGCTPPVCPSGYTSVGINGSYLVGGIYNPSSGMDDAIYNNSRFCCK